MAKDTLGEFELLVLLATLRLGENAYGLSIADEIERTAGRGASRASVYVTLRRLEKNGLVTTRREAPQDAPNGKPRRFVSLQPRALEMVGESRRSLQRMWTGIEDVLEDA